MTEEPVCRHERLHELSEATLRTTWERQEDGTYDPDAEHKVLGEETQWFECVECRTRVSLTDDYRIDDDV